jgi:CO/xanthine dehydrogenase Mo-binding subunit
MEHIARDLGENPLDFRMGYLAKQNDRTSTNGLYRDPIIMPDLIDKAMAMSDYKTKWKKYEKSDAFKGIGMSFFLHGCGFTGSGEAETIKAKVKLKKTADEQVHILVAAVDMGQGIKTTLPKLVADILEIPMAQVTFDFPDTDAVPDSGPTVASRTIMIVGGLVARAARQLKRTWVKNKTQIVEERYRPPEYIKWDDETFQGDAYPAYSWGVHVCEVEVDPRTFEVMLKGLWGAYDMGRAIDERIVHGQVDGGFLQGIAYGYMEVMDHHDGVIAQSNFTDYMIPTFEDVCPIETAIIDNPYPLGPYGAKGMGELPLIGGAPAVAKAIGQAIKKRVKTIPVTPELIMELMDDGND